MLRYLQPSSWFFIFLALILGFYFTTKVQTSKRHAPNMMASPAVLISFGR